MAVPLRAFEVGPLPNENCLTRGLAEVLRLDCGDRPAWRPDAGVHPLRGNATEEAIL